MKTKKIHTFHTALSKRHLFMGWQYMKYMKYTKHVFEQISQKVSLTKRAVWKVHFVLALLARFLLWYLHIHMFHIYHVFSCHDCDRIHSKKFNGLYAWGLFNVFFCYFHIVSCCFYINSASGVENWDRLTWFWVVIVWDFKKNYWIFFQQVPKITSIDLGILWNQLLVSVDVCTWKCMNTYICVCICMYTYIYLYLYVTYIPLYMFTYM